MSLQPAQTPFERGVRHVVPVERRAQSSHRVHRGRLVAGREKPEIVAWWTYRMDVREFAAQPFAELRAVATPCGVPGQHVSGRRSSNATHHEETASDDVAVLTQPQNLRHGDAGLEGRLQQSKLPGS